MQNLLDTFASSFNLNDLYKLTLQKVKVYPIVNENLERITTACNLGHLR
jgi:hypothetical protein